MFSSSSTHLRHWIFDKLDDVHLLREETNLRAREKYEERVDSSTDDDCLSVAEELIVLRRYQSFLETLCDKTEPPVPCHTRAVAVTYVRRFYVHHSVIDFHPREVMLTAIWIAMKVEEFNLSLAEFGRCIPRNATKYMEIIRASELFLIERLNYDLLVHVPTRAIDGLVAEWRAYLTTVMREKRSSDRSGASDDEASMQDDSWEIVNERACSHATELSYRSVHTDAMFVLSPTQIALGALQKGIEHCEDVLLISRFADFVLERLCEDRNDVYDRLMGKVKQLEAIVTATETSTSEETIAAEEKLDKCRNPEYNFDSEIYKEKKRLWTERYEKL